jgi:hypothetical protein
MTPTADLEGTKEHEEHEAFFSKSPFVSLVALRDFVMNLAFE